MHGMYYTAHVNTKKVLIGCGSPKARGAEPHPARFAAFLFLAPSFGGPNGEAQASPVTLRVPRSSTPVRAAAQCGSWSAVVHQAQLERPMVQTSNTLARDILSAWETEREQLASLIGAVSAGLERRASTDFLHYREWRLAQVAEGLTDEAAVLEHYRALAGGAQ